MIANDVIEALIDLVAQNGDDATAADLLVSVGLAPDEVRRIGALALWRRSHLRGNPTVDQMEMESALWIDGFLLGIATSRRLASESPRSWTPRRPAP